MLVQKSLKTHRTELFILLLENSLHFDIDSFSFIPFYLFVSFGCTGIQLRCSWLQSYYGRLCWVSCSSYLFLQATVMEYRLCLGTGLDTCSTDSVVLASVQQLTIQGKKMVYSISWFPWWDSSHRGRFQTISVVPLERGVGQKCAQTALWASMSQLQHTTDDAQMNLLGKFHDGLRVCWCMMSTFPLGLPWRSHVNGGNKICLIGFVLNELVLFPNCNELL